MAGAPLEQLNSAIKALRFTLWAAERDDVLAAGGTDDDVPLCPVDKLELGEALALAGLVIAVRRELAEQQGITDPAGRAEFVRSQLLGELESLDLAASFAAVDAEFAE